MNESDDGGGCCGAIGVLLVGIWLAMICGLVGLGWVLRGWLGE